MFREGEIKTFFSRSSFQFASSFSIQSMSLEYEFDIIGKQFVCCFCLYIIFVHKLLYFISILCQKNYYFFRMQSRTSKLNWNKFRVELFSNLVYMIETIIIKNIKIHIE